VLWPLRIAIAGVANTPGGAFEIAYLLGRDEISINEEEIKRRAIEEYLAAQKQEQAAPAQPAEKAAAPAAGGPRRLRALLRGRCVQHGLCSCLPRFLTYLSIHPFIYFSRDSGL